MHKAFVVSMDIVLFYLALILWSFGVDGHLGGHSSKQTASYNNGMRAVSYADEYLNQYGYMHQYYRNVRNQRKHAIREFQKNVGLRETGKLNRKTIRKMNEPRCAVPDNEENEGHSRSKRYIPETLYWRKHLITWSPENYSRKLPKSMQWRIFKKALKTWSDVIPRKFRYVTRKGDLGIKFARWSHGDGHYNAFDGKGHRLAHAFSPGKYELSGDTHFDEDEEWQPADKPFDPDVGPSLLFVATHEFGHALGLPHTTDRNSLMSPYFTHSKTELTETDIKAAERIYGKKTSRRQGYKTVEKSATRNSVLQATTPSNTQNDMAKKAKLNCSSIDAIFIDNDKMLNVVSNQTVFRVSRRRFSGPPVMFQSDFPGAPYPPGALMSVNGMTYIFKGSHVWRYTDKVLDDGYPKYVREHGRGEKPRAAVVYENNRNKRIFLFGRSKFWGWHAQREVVSRGVQYETRRYWRGIPRDIDAAIMWKDRFIYFIKGDLYYKVSQRYRHLVRGYPKRIPPPWLQGVC